MKIFYYTHRATTAKEEQRTEIQIDCLWRSWCGSSW